MAGLTDEGFVTKRLVDIIEERKTLARTLFQDLVPAGEEVDTTDSSVLGRLINLTTPAEADVWAAMLDIYNSMNPETATGNALDNAVLRSGLRRFRGEPTSVEIMLKGGYGNTASDIQFSSPTTGKKYELDSPVAFTGLKASSVSVDFVGNATSTAPISFRYRTYGVASWSSVSITPTIGQTPASMAAALKIQLDALGLFTTTQVGSRLDVMSNDPLLNRDFDVDFPMYFVYIWAAGVAIGLEDGPIEQPAGSLTVIDTPKEWLYEVSNLVAGVAGKYLETDEELRQRFQLNKTTTGTGTVDSLYSSLQNLEGVDQVIVIENDSDVTDSLGIPSHSVMCVLDGGSNADIAKAIWKVKPCMGGTYGNTSVSIADSQGINHTIKFHRATAVNVYVSVSLTTDSDFPADGIDKIKSALVSYIKGLKIGDDVVYSRLYTPINTVMGHQINSLHIGTSASPTGTANIAVTAQQRAKLAIENIVVTI